MSRGGLFLATEDPFELFSDVELEVALPGGRCTTLRARVVHILSVEKARSFGVTPGVGVQFEQLDDAQRASVAELVEWARAEDPRPRIAHVKAAADTSVLQSQPMLSYLLEHIDGRRDPEALAEELGLELAVVERMLAELCKLGLVELDAAKQAAKPAPEQAAKPTASLVRAPRSASGRAAAAPPSTVTGNATAAEASRASPVRSTATDPTWSAQLAQLEARLADANHYELLDVTTTARAEQIRAVFHARAGQLRSGAATREQTERVERVVAHLHEACGVLTSPDKRAEYDEYLDRASRLQAAEARRALLVAQAPKSVPPRADSDPAGAPVRPSTPRVLRTASDKTRDAARPDTAAGAQAQAQLGAAARLLAEAERSHAAGQSQEAARQLRRLSAMTFTDATIRARATELRGVVARTLAVEFEKQAAYEEKQQHWAAAAQSWLRVAEGRPKDSVPLQRAALSQLQAGADLREVMELGKRAVELAQNDPQAHRTLARIYVAANMQANARRELEAAKRCEPQVEVREAEKPAGGWKRWLGRDAPST